MLRQTASIRLCAIVLIAFFALTPLCADIADHRDNVREAREAGKKEEVRKEEDQEDGDSALGSFIFELFGLLWAYNNLWTTYSPYPYAEGPFIRFPVPSVPSAGQDIQWIPATRKNHWLALETSGVWMDGIGFGSWSSLRGHFWRFFGPSVDVILLADGRETLPSARIGGNFSLLQFNRLSMNIVAQYVTGSMEEEQSGSCVGLDIVSYPVRPVSLRFRVSSLNYEYHGYTETDLSLGVFSGPVEFFAGWRYWQLQTRGGTVMDRYHGIFAGAGYRF